MIALDPARGELFVGRSMTAVNPPPRIGVIQRSDMKLDEVEVLFPRPHAMAANPQGTWAFSASLGENRIAAVNATTDEVTLTSLPGSPMSMVQFAISPDGRTMVVGGELTGDFMIFDISAPPAVRLVKTIPDRRPALDPRVHAGRTVRVHREFRRQHRDRDRHALPERGGGDQGRGPGPAGWRRDLSRRSLRVLRQPARAARRRADERPPDGRRATRITVRWWSSRPGPTRS